MRLYLSSFRIGACPGELLRLCGDGRRAAVIANGLDAQDAASRAAGVAPAAVEALVTALGVGPRMRVVDVGAGTGKLTRQLLGTGAHLVAVEPVAAMRGELRRALPGVAVVGGTAEALPLRAGSAAAAVVGQAWHWFDGPAALAELARVIAPGGGLALLWYGFDLAVPWAAALAAVRDRRAPPASPTPGPPHGAASSTRTRRGRRSPRRASPTPSA